MARAGLGEGPVGGAGPPQPLGSKLEGATLVVGMGSGSLSWLPRTCSEVWGLAVG